MRVTPTRRHHDVAIVWRLVRSDVRLSLHECSGDQGRRQKSEQRMSPSPHGCDRRAAHGVVTVGDRRLRAPHNRHAAEVAPDNAALRPGVCDPYIRLAAETRGRALALGRTVRASRRRTSAAAPGLGLRKWRPTSLSSFLTETEISVRAGERSRRGSMRPAVFSAGQRDWRRAGSADGRAEPVLADRPGAGWT